MVWKSSFFVLFFCFCELCFSVVSDKHNLQVAKVLCLNPSLKREEPVFCGEVTDLTGYTLFQEVDDFFEQEKTFLVNYYNRIKDACAKADKMTRSHKSESFQRPF